MGGMATIVFLHAHPDDEASGTSGTMTRLSREGHRVVVVYGTGGELGTAPEHLPVGTTLAGFRRAEAEATAPSGSRWERLAHAVMRRPIVVLVPTLAVLLDGPVWAARATTVSSLRRSARMTSLPAARRR